MAPQPSAPPLEDEDPQPSATPLEGEEVFGTDPPSKMMTLFDAIVIILYYIGLDLGISMLLLIKHVKDNWPLYKCKTNYMLFAWFFGYDTDTNFQQCMQTMQSGYMTILMRPAKKYRGSNTRHLTSCKG